MKKKIKILVLALCLSCVISNKIAYSSTYDYANNKTMRLYMIDPPYPEGGTKK